MVHLAHERVLAVGILEGGPAEDGRGGEAADGGHGPVRERQLRHKHGPEEVVEDGRWEERRGAAREGGAQEVVHSGGCGGGSMEGTTDAGGEAQEMDGAGEGRMSVGKRQNVDWRGRVNMESWHTTHPNAQLVPPTRGEEKKGQHPLAKPPGRVLHAPPNVLRSPKKLHASKGYHEVPAPRLYIVL